MAMSIKPISSFGNLPFEVRDKQEVVIKHVFPSVSIDLTCHFPYTELAKLYRMIEASLPNKSRRIVQFMSAYKEEGASEIAFEAAIIAARLIGLRVLFVDTATTLANRRVKQFPGMPTTSLETLLLAGASPYEAIAQAAGTKLYLAMLCEKGDDGLAPISLNAIDIALENLRPYFDLIIIDSPAILNDAFGMALAKLVDGSVMVIEAERTRAPVARECKRLIEEGGGNLIGAAMNRRRFYIPDNLYRLFYQRVAI